MRGMEQMVIEMLLPRLGIDPAAAQALFARVAKEGPELIALARDKMIEIEARLQEIDDQLYAIRARLGEMEDGRTYRDCDSGAGGGAGVNSGSAAAD